MKILPFQIPKPEESAFIVQEDKVVLFYDKYHQHKEIQISYIASGSGTLLIGDTITSYTKGDIIVIGSQLPHVFLSSKESKKLSYMISFFFTKNSFGKAFFNLKELKSLSPFFALSESGFVTKAKDHTLHNSFKTLPKQNSFNQFLTLLKTINNLSKAPKKLFNTYIASKQLSDNEGKRIQEVMQYTMRNFTKPITLSQIAEVANMSKNAFCKYFKKRTNKTYFIFLNEVRIAHACELLRAKKEYSIAEIAELSGYNNIANFNRQFKRLKQCTPLQYKLGKLWQQ